MRTNISMPHFNTNIHTHMTSIINMRTQTGGTTRSRMSIRTRTPRSCIAIRIAQTRIIGMRIGKLVAQWLGQPLRPRNLQQHRMVDAEPAHGVAVFLEFACRQIA